MSAVVIKKVLERGHVSGLSDPQLADLVQLPR